MIDPNWPNLLQWAEQDRPSEMERERESSMPVFVLEPTPKGSVSSKQGKPALQDIGTAVGSIARDRNIA